MRTRFALQALLVAAMLMFVMVPVGRADLVSIGLQQAGVNGGAITTVASGAGSAIYSGVYGTFSLNQASGAGTPPNPEPQFGSSTINTSTSTAGTLIVWVSEQGLTMPTGVFQLVSGFTENNSLPAGWSVTEETFIDTGNGLYATTTPLGNASFTGIGSTTMVTSTPSISGAYSLTEKYTIVAAGTGQANSTIQIAQQVPEPASMMLLGTGLLGIGGMIRRRLRK